MSTLPDSWHTCKLGDVINYGATQKAEPTEIPDDAWVLELEDIEKDTSKVLQRLTFKRRQSKKHQEPFFGGRHTLWQAPSLSKQSSSRRSGRILHDRDYSHQTHRNS